MPQKNNAIEVEDLSVRLPFARKPADLSEVGGEGNYKVFVTETWEMTPAEFAASKSSHCRLPSNTGADRSKGW